MSSPALRRGQPDLLWALEAAVHRPTRRRMCGSAGYRARWVTDVGLVRERSGNRLFFVSHVGRDTGWAEWLAWQLEQAGYSVELDVWDWAPGEDFVARMQTAEST